MADSMRKSAEFEDSDLGLEGFEQFFGDESESAAPGKSDATVAGEALGEQLVQVQFEKLLERMTEILSFSVDQRIETAKIANQLMDNQRQLIATQQILIRLMERSLELTRHVSAIEERLPALFDLPRTVESLRQRVAQLEGIEIE